VRLAACRQAADPERPVLELPVARARLEVVGLGHRVERVHLQPAVRSAAVAVVEQGVVAAEQTRSMR